ncbi:LamG-like jellyroll fold domain-containing protein [Streptosporangium amethystogenes]|uniref:LamG-like jellyroll fold domain-containing protein n=1 Tax=Streptosporangium amethystogenes TaxID=2002 RepID=UPI0012FA7067|nr:LamG-like jellyroll fold domain-containing protein [Streptosporangium amethystogenes]
MTISALAASLLVAGGSIPAQADPGPDNPAVPAAPKTTEFPRPEDPDAVLRAALEEAKKQNKPVEVQAAYTEGSRTWAYPDGHLTTQSYAGPAQLKQADGAWAWIDTTLVEQGGVLRPKLAKAKVEFSAGGADRPFASMERGDGQKVSFNWPTELPKPTVEGNVATFVNAAGQGADLVVTALPTGFRHDVVLREQPKEPVEFRIPVETDGLDFAEGKQGGLELTDAKGKRVASAAEPVIIDAGPSPAETKNAGVVPPRTGKINTRVVKEKDGQVLVLTPDPKFLADPATRYPVTVDPTTTLTLQSDLVVSNAAGADTSSASERLVTSIERTNSAGTLTYSHSLLKFDTGPLVGRSVGSARLDMYADQLVGCRWYGPAGIEAKRVTSAWPPYVGWSNQPSVTSFGSSVQLCPSTSSVDDNGNWIPRTFTWSVTAMAQAWAAGQPNEGIRLSGKGTTDPAQNSGWWVYFHSSEKAGGTRPKLTVSYFLPPEIPTVTAESIDSMDGNDAIARSTSVKVGFKSSVPEGTNLDYTVAVNDSTMLPPPAFPTGHVAHWKFDEAAGATAAADASGNNHTATYTGSRRVATTGKLGGALQLNDMTGSNGCCIPDSYAATSRSVLNQNSSFSISTWVRLKDSEAIQYVASQDGDPFGLSIYYLGGSYQKWRLQVSGTGGTTGYGVWVDSAKLATADTWTHLTAMYDAGASKIRLYVDGVLSGEADYQPSETVTSGPFRVGGHKSGLNLLQGAVDDMRLYQRALSLADIKKLYGEVAATSYNAKPSGQVIEQTFALDNPASFKFVVRACRSGVTQPSCNESPAYRITSDAPMLPTDTETGMADPTRPILSGMVNRPSGGPVTAKYFLYDNGGFPVGSSPLGRRTVNGGERASFQVPENIVQGGRTYTWQMQACVGQESTTPEPTPTPTSTPTPTPTVDPQQKARWAFDEGSGTAAADSSGNSRTVTLNAASWGTGKSQGGLVLGGTSGYGATNGPVIHTNAGYTVSAWARLDATTREDAIVSQDGAVNSAFKLAYSSGDKKWRMVTYQSDTTGATPVRALSTQNAVAGQWTHLVGVYDATAQKIRLYVDGVLNAETAYTSSWDATGNVHIGRTKANGSQNSYFKGIIDDVHLYQKSLTGAEITTLYNGAAQVATASAAPADTQATTQNGEEVCTAKTTPVSFTTPGTPADPPAEDIRHLTLLKDNFVVKTAKVDPTACDGSPCTVTDSTTMQIGGSGTDKTVAVIGFRLDELPDGARVSEGVLKLGTPTCSTGTCPADTVITVTTLKSPVTGASKGSDLAGDADTTDTPYSLPLTALQADIAGNAYQWLLLTSNKDEVITFGEAASAEQPSLALTYVPAGPPSKVLNLAVQAGDGGASASWGLPESNGSLAMLDGYDVEVTDSSGTVVKTIDVKDPYAAITGLTNGAAYSVKVRAKTAFGVGEWEAASVTPKAVPPPPVKGAGETCVLERGQPPQMKTASVASGAQEYLQRVTAYYQAQDAVLEGRAETVWDAPGITPQASSTAKLSLLNTNLVRLREAMQDGDITRSNSTVELSDSVVRARPDGSVMVFTKVNRTWTETDGSTDGTGQVKRSVTSTAAAAGGQVEPSEPSIDVFVFDRCGDITIINVPLPQYEDQTDHFDACGGNLLPGDSGGTLRVAADDPPTSACVFDPSNDRLCTSIRAQGNNCVTLEAQPGFETDPFDKKSVKPMKGLTFRGSGVVAWRDHEYEIVSVLNIAKSRIWVQAYMTKAFIKKYGAEDFVTKMKISAKPRWCGVTQLGDITVTYPPAFTPSTVEDCREKAVSDNPVGVQALSYPTGGNDSARIICNGLCDIRRFKFAFTAELFLPYADKKIRPGRVPIGCETRWLLPLERNPSPTPGPEPKP